MAVATYTKTGTKAAAAAKLDKSVFGVEVKSHELVKSAYVAYLANGRKSTATTKTRGLVSGGGRKPWRQKGTGRARFGSIRNPIWRGGGIVFGPDGTENYTHKLHAKAKKQAARQALTMASKGGKIKVIEAIDFKDAKAAKTAKLLNKIETKGSTLLVIKDMTKEADRSTKNIDGVKTITASYLNVYDVMNADTIVITGDALKTLHEKLGGDK